MKRGKPLARKKPLSRNVRLSAGKDAPSSTTPSTASLRARERRRVRMSEPGYAEWHAPVRGKCSVCRMPGPLQRHHAVQEQRIRRAGGDPWDLRWSIPLGRHCDCHEHHHSRGVSDRRLDYRYVPMDAVRLAYRVFGPWPAASYFKRRYRNAPEIDEREVDLAHYSEAAGG